MAARRGQTLVVTGALMAWPVTCASPAIAASRFASSTTSNATSGGGLLLAMGAGILVLAGIGFFVLTLSRRKRKPEPCAPEREALELAERSVRYWEGALTHLQALGQERGSTGASVASEVDGTTSAANTTEATGESHASLLEKALSGYSTAIQLRDGCQIELIKCMAAGVPGTPITNPYHLSPEDEPPPTEFEDI